MTNELTTIIQSLHDWNVRFLRFVWTDNAGLIRAKAASVAALRNGWNDGTVGNTVAQQALTAFADAVADGSGLTPAGEMDMVPDWSTLMPLPYAPTHARVMTEMYVDGEPWGLCPRALLKRAAAAAAEQGITIDAAFECEFYLLKTVGDEWLSVDNTLYAQTAALDAMAPVLDAITTALESQGLTPELLHAESGPGQFELPVRFAPALAAADHQVVFRETVRAVAQQHGYLASFVPKIFPNAAGNGAHLHLSLSRDGQNVMGDPARAGVISETAGHFIAGLLHHLPALLAITAPLPNSYKRLLPHTWSAPFTAWGYANREAAIRVPKPRPGRPVTNVELKTVDATSNPYLVVGAVVYAGLDGLRQQLPPPDPVDQDPADLGELERRRRGIHSLPAHLPDAIHALEHDDYLLKALGTDLARAVLAIRRADHEAMKDLPHADEVRLLTERY